MVSDLDSADIKQFQFPITMVWEITNKCPSNCMYCSGSFPEKQGNVEMASEEKKQFVQECIDNRLFAINISGGEPFLSDDLLWVVDELTKAEIQVMVVTSGLIHDDEKISSLVANPYVGLNVSLDSFTPEINDYHRGISHSVDRVKEFLRKISAERKYIALECVLTRRNYKDVESYIEKVSEFPVSEVRFQPVIAMSQKMIDSQLYLDDEEIHLAKAKVEELAEKTKHTRVRFVDQSNTIIGGFRTTRNWGGIVGPDGELTVNAYLPFEFGKISDYGGFKAAWDRGFAHAWDYPQIYTTISNIKSINDVMNLYRQCGYKTEHITL
ncbi:MAG: Fe-coproporphyrin synthase [Methanolobus sp.]|nr:Fe-coproporphyrin synthase [Methanolobus sp.]